MRIQIVIKNGKSDPDRIHIGIKMESRIRMGFISASKWKVGSGTALHQNVADPQHQSCGSRCIAGSRSALKFCGSAILHNTALKIQKKIRIKNSKGSYGISRILNILHRYLVSVFELHFSSFSKKFLLLPQPHCFLGCTVHRRAEIFLPGLHCFLSLKRVPEPEKKIRYRSDRYDLQYNGPGGPYKEEKNK